MIEEFKGQRTAFAELLKMALEERRVTRVADDFIWIDDMQNVSELDRTLYLSNERLARYRSLFRKLKLEGGIVHYQNGNVGFLRSGSGIVTSGSSKEFIWAKRISAAVLTPSDKRSLEDACAPKTGCNSVRQIASHWFISFDSH